MRVRLDNVCECASSNLAQKDINDIDGIYPIYGACGYIGNVDFYHQEKAYVAVVKDGAGVGRTMLLPGKSSVIGTLQYLIPKGDILPEFLAFAVQSMHLEKYYTGATIPHIYFRDYKKEEFELPNIVEQKEIVNILKKVSGTIELRKQQLEEFDGLIKAQFVEMFGELQNIQYATVAEVCEIITDGTHQPPKFVE
ncbi:MAG: restriction endonuclease subunit S, partial [Lachnospiraceae bacterium]|nr:restriction endonuclease subunit S [Lachnospiraceae bacterium]